MLPAHLIQLLSLATPTRHLLVQAQTDRHPHRHPDIQESRIPPVHILKKVPHQRQRLHTQDTPLLVRIRQQLQRVSEILEPGRALEVDPLVDAVQLPERQDDQDLGVTQARVLVGQVPGRPPPRLEEERLEGVRVGEGEDGADVGVLRREEAAADVEGRQPGVDG
jgi:hypothetical protein